MKKGLSPVIATVLLVAIVVVIALILFLWFRGITKETITKFGGENIELACDKVAFTADYSNGIFYISNIGNVPIYSLSLDFSTPRGTHTSKSIREISTNPAWPSLGLNQGATYSGDLGGEANGAEKITVTPILMGSSEKGQKTYLCSKSSNSKEIIIQ